MIENYSLRRARSVLKRPPNESEYKGFSYEDASKMATAISQAAVETGRTVNAAKHLSILAEIMESKWNP